MLINVFKNKMKNFFELLLTYLLVAVINPTFSPEVVHGKKESHFPSHSSVNNQITKMVNPGERINIPCSVVSPGGSVQWVQNNKPILLDFSLNQRRHWNISNDGQAALTINRVTRTDEGVWECWELDGEGKAKQKAQVMKLVVTNVPEAPYIQLEGRRLADQATITVREKNIIKLNCVVRGASPPISYVHWYLADENVTQSSQLLMEYSAEEDVSMAISVLEVNVTRQLHSKLVICQVYHVSWMNSATVSASFNVLYVPSFSISREPGFGFPIVEGMTVSLKCEIDANPLSIPKWNRESKTSLPQLETNHDGTLNFTYIKKHDSGWYRCTTQHEFGYFASFAYFLNVRDPEDLSQIQNVLQSNSYGESINKDTEMKKEPNEAALIKEKHEARSSIEPASNNYGDVMVSAKYHHKHQRQSIHNGYHQLKECSDSNGKPVLESINRSLTAIVGKPFYLTAKFCCNPRPKKVYWIHRHLAMTPGRVIGPYITRDLMNAKNSAFCYTSSFEIATLKPEDAGEIVFIVGNTKGIEDSIVLLNISQASLSLSRGSAFSVVNCNIFHCYSIVLLMVMLTITWIQ